MERKYRESLPPDNKLASSFNRAIDATMATAPDADQGVIPMKSRGGTETEDTQETARHRNKSIWVSSVPPPNQMDKENENENEK